MNAIQEAIIKINTEMQAKPDDLYLEAIGQHVIDRCGNVAAAEAVLKKRQDPQGCYGQGNGSCQSAQAGQCCRNAR